MSATVANRRVMNNVMLRGMVTSLLGAWVGVWGRKGQVLRSERGGAGGGDARSRLMMRVTDQPYSENKELCGRDRFESDPIAQPLNAPRELVDEMGLSTIINVMGPQLPIGFVADEHMEGTDHDRVRDRNNGPFLSPAGGQPLI
jgi:hypothetical protein